MARGTRAAAELAAKLTPGDKRKQEDDQSGGDGARGAKLRSILAGSEIRYFGFTRDEFITSGVVKLGLARFQLFASVAPPNLAGASLYN